MDEVNGANCRAYVEHRLAEPWKAAKPDRTGRAPRMVTAAAARRELEDLRAAIKSSPSGGVVFRGRIRGPAGTADHP